MTPAQRPWIKPCAVIVAIALAWVAAFHLNEWAFAATEQTPRANWIFLPASVRILAVLLFDELGATGLVVGAFLTLQENERGIALQSIIVSLTSGIAPLIAVSGVKHWYSIPATLAGLRPLHIVALTMACATSNAVILNGYLWLVGNLDADIDQLAAVFVGDVFGMAIVLLTLSTALSFTLPRRR